MHGRARIYEHSGVVPIVGLGLVAGVSAGAAYALGWVYGVAIYWMPFVYLAFLLPLVLAAALGATVAFAGRAGKVRSAGVCAFAGLAAGLGAQVVQWQVWLDWFLEPGQLAQLGGALPALSAIAEQGAWSIFGWTPTGGVLWTIWGLEGLVVVGGTTAVAFGAIADVPFCERCEVWLTQATTISPFDFVYDGDQLKATLETGDFAPLQAMEKIRPGATQYAAIDLLECRKCHHFRLVSVKNVVKKQEDGKEESEETPIVQNLIVDSQTWDVLAKQV
ncbi:MAG: hypothetical protein ACQGVK_11375 [Myxococcota bacterium]